MSSQAFQGQVVLVIRTINPPTAHEFVRGSIKVTIVIATLAAVGTSLVAFGTVYTITPSCTPGGAFYGYPIWATPGCSQTGTPPSLEFVSASYTLNYAGAAILLAALATAIAAWRPDPTSLPLLEDRRG